MGKLLLDFWLVKPSEESPVPVWPAVASPARSPSCRQHQSPSLPWNNRDKFCHSAELVSPGVALCKRRLSAVAAEAGVGQSLLFSLSEAPAPRGPALPRRRSLSRPGPVSPVSPQAPLPRAEAGAVSVVLLGLSAPHPRREARPSLRCLLQPLCPGVSAPLCPRRGQRRARCYRTAKTEGWARPRPAAPGRSSGSRGVPSGRPRLSA